MAKVTHGDVDALVRVLMPRVQYAAALAVIRAGYPNRNLHGTASRDQLRQWIAYARSFRA